MMQLDKKTRYLSMSFLAMTQGMVNNKDVDAQDARHSKGCTQDPLVHLISSLRLVGSVCPSVRPINLFSLSSSFRFVLNTSCLN